MNPEEITIPYERCNKQGKIFAIANRLGYDLPQPHKKPL